LRRAGGPRPHLVGVFPDSLKSPDPVFSLRLKMVKRPFQWYSKGKWIIKFFLKTNIDVDMK
jgi:hypothetical protein